MPRFSRSPRVSDGDGHCPQNAPDQPWRLARVAQFSIYVVVRLAICIVQAVPIERCAAAAEWLGWLISDVVGVRKRLIDENLQLAFPQWSPEKRSDVRRRMWSHLFLFVAEVAHTPRKIHDTNWRDFVRLKNAPDAVRLLLADRPVMLITAHHGNFELAGYILGILGFPTYSVARPLDNPYLDRFVNRFRGLTGQFIVPKKGGYDQIVQVLSSGGTMSFLADQYAGTKGCWVNFFGRPASAHKAIALLAMNHEASLVVGCARRLDKPLTYELTIQATLAPHSAPMIGVQSLTQWYTSQLEHMVREAPQQYWWLHRRWRDRRPPRGRRQAA
jgi:KDO2-lipid IV(A) lauroyltransferase